MPFTLSHAAAALPLRRLPLIPSALVIGTVAPDLEYFLRLEPGGGWGHTIPGAFGLSLPLGLITLWLFHGFVKVPAAMLLPATVQRRLEPELHPFPFSGLRRFIAIVVSLLVGIATHLVWDQFTHYHSWVCHRVEFLRHVVKLPLIGWINYAGLLQYLSSILGLVALAIWLKVWYARTRPQPVPVLRELSPGHKAAIVALMAVVATIGAVLRVVFGTGIPPHLSWIKRPIGQASVTFLAVAWWELIAWGFRLRARIPHPAARRNETPMGRETRDLA